MPIQYVHSRSGSFPQIICDVCKKPVRQDQGYGGMVGWNEAGNIAFGHKGECSHKMNFRTGWPYWEDLDVFIYQLAHNTRLDMKAAKKRALFFDRIGLSASASRKELDK